MILLKKKILKENAEITCGLCSPLVIDFISLNTVFKNDVWKKNYTKYKFYYATVTILLLVLMLQRTDKL
jgi:hypothetical protein